MVPCMAALYLASAAASPPAAVKIDPASEPMALLINLYDENGWSREDAAALAVRTLLIARGVDVDDHKAKAPLDEGVEVVLDGDSDPLALLKEAFQESGWTAQEATDHAVAMLAQVKAKPAGWLQGEGDLCLAYTLRIVSCENGIKKRREVQVDAVCWEEIENCAGPIAPNCDPDCAWYEMDNSCAIGGGFSCIYITDRSLDTVDVPCDSLTFNCECLTCDLTVSCAPCSAGPPLCPDCD